MIPGLGRLPLCLLTRLLRFGDGFSLSDLLKQRPTLASSFPPLLPLSFLPLLPPVTLHAARCTLPSSRFPLPSSLSRPPRMVFA